MRDQKKNEPLAPAPVAAPEPTPTPDPGPAGDFVISFDDDSSRPRKSAPPLADTNPTPPVTESPPASAAEPALSRYEIVQSWSQVLADFRQQEPMAGVYLEGTHLVRGEYSESPLRLSIHFPHQHAFQHQQFQSHGEYLRHLSEYLESLLQYPISLQLSLEPAPENPAPESAAPIAGPAAAWNQDRAQEPILHLLAETFETIHLSTTRRQGEPI